MSNQTSGYRPPRRITWQSGVQPPGDTGVPNQSSSFKKYSGLSVVREVDGTPTITDATVLEVSDGTLTEPSPGVARVATGGAGSTLEVREIDGTPSIHNTTVIEVTNTRLTNPAAGVARVDVAGMGSALELREVLLTFSALVAPGTAINIQTGAYAGPGSPAAVAGDTNVTLPTSGTLFRGDGRIEVHLNGQELAKGDGTGNGVAEWVSSTQIKLNLKIKDKGCVMVRAPIPTA